MTERDDENSHDCVSVWATKCLTSNINIVELTSFMAVYARCFADNIL